MIINTNRKFERRAFLRGAGGAMLALPALEALMPRQARAQAPTKKIYAVFMLQMNGHIQELFYPRAVGALNAATMAGADADRTASELKDHAADVTFVRGIDHSYDIGPGCGHPLGGNIVLTASKFTSLNNRSLPTRESADYRIGMAFGKEPLNLYAGRKESYIADNFAYGPGGKIRVANNKPYDVYQTMMGLTPAVGGDPALAARLAAREKSINDVLRAQMQDLFKRTDISTEDRRRLDVHFQSIRELEINMTRPVMGIPGDRPLSEVVMTLKDTPDANDLMEEATRAQLSLIALAFATDRVQAATLQIGAGQDQTRYLINGTRASGYHGVTHAVGAAPGPGRDEAAAAIHHQVDRIHARHFKFLIERLKLYKTADGRPLLEDSVAVWTNQLSAGYKHHGIGVPHVYAGSAGGYLKTGTYVDVTTVKNSKFLNTMITAAGVRKANGDPVDDFGDPDNQKGLLTEIIR